MLSLRRTTCVAALLFAAGVFRAACAADIDWPSYNRTLSSERYAPLDEVTPSNVARLKRICTYSIGGPSAFETGIVVVARTLYFTSLGDTFAVDATTCAEKWRAREVTVGGSTHGVAYGKGRVFRGLRDGRVLAYDAASGKKLWERRIANSTKTADTVGAAPIYWQGMVFIGTAGGGFGYGVKGRLYGLDAKTGRILWETYLVPRDNAQSPTAMEKIALPTWGNEKGVQIGGGATWTSYSLDEKGGALYVPVGNPSPSLAVSLRPGANLFTNSVVVLDAKTGVYRNHYSIVPNDFHDWDVAAPPVLATTKAARHIIAAAPKDGILYGFDLASGKRLYASPITRRENVTAPITKEGTHFCPGISGGTEWNGPAYNPNTNLIYSGTVDWCVTAKLGNVEEVKTLSTGAYWTGGDNDNPRGVFDPESTWSGWITATDADTGGVKWKLHAETPILAGVTTTKGNLVFYADLNGHGFALDAATGKEVWRTDLGGSSAGGVVSYSIDGKQRIAFTAGLSDHHWAHNGPSRIVVYGLR